MMKIKTIILLFVLLVILPVVCFSFRQSLPVKHFDNGKKFTSMGPGGGGQMYGVGISPHDSSLMHVSCDMGTFYVSEDGGDHWTMVDQDEMVGIKSTRPLYHTVKRNIVIMPYYRYFRQLRISYDKGYHWEILYGKVTVKNFKKALNDSKLNYSRVFKDREVVQIVAKLSEYGVLNDRGRVKIRWLKKLPDDFIKDKVFHDFPVVKFKYLLDVLNKIHEVPWGFPRAKGSGDKFDEGITSMAMDPLNPEVIFVSTLNGLYRSNDGGESFIEDTVLRKLVKGVYISSDSSLKPRFVAADSEHVYSSDNGKKWVEKGKGLNGSKIYGLSCATYNNQIYCYIITDDGVYYSSNSGKSFKKNAYRSQLISIYDRSPKFKFRFVSVSEKNPKVAYVSNRNSNWKTFGVFKTEDGGVNWKNVFDPYGAWKSKSTIKAGWVGNSHHIIDKSWGGSANCITIAPDDENIVAYVNAMEFYLTKDGGKTWTEKASKYYDTNSKYRMDYTFSGRGLEVALPTDMIWDPFIADRVYLIYGDALYFVSKDRGRTWRRKVSGIPYKWGIRMWSLVPDPSEKNILYSAVSNNHGSIQSMAGYKTKRGGVLISKNGGESWHPIVGGEITVADFESQGLSLNADQLDNLLLYKLNDYVTSFLVNNNLNKSGPPVKHKRIFFAKSNYSSISNSKKILLGLAGYSLEDVKKIDKVLIKSRDFHRLPFEKYPCVSLVAGSESLQGTTKTVLYALYPVEGVYKGMAINGRWHWDRISVKGLGRYDKRYDNDAIEGTGPGTGRLENKIFEQLKLGPDGSLYCLTIGRKEDWGWRFGTYPDGGIWRIKKEDIAKKDASWVEITSEITKANPTNGHGFCDPKYYAIDYKSKDLKHPTIFLSTSFQSGGEKNAGLWRGKYSEKIGNWKWSLVIGLSDLNRDQFLYGWVQAGDVSFHPEKPYVYYSTKTHGLWVSESNGEQGTWHRVKGIPRLATGKVVADPVDPDIIYVNSVGLWKGPATGYR